MSFLLAAYLVTGVVLGGYWLRLERQRTALRARLEDRGGPATPPNS